MKEILIFLRKQKNLSQQDVAAKIGLSRQSYIKYEKGEVTPSDETVKKLAEFYEVEEDFIRKNQVPDFRKQTETAFQYKIDENFGLLKVEEPEKLSFDLNKPGQKVYDAYFDGSAVRLLGEVKLEKGQKLKVVVSDSEEDAQKRREMAWDVIHSLRGRWAVPEDWNYKEELQKTREEKFL